MYFATLLPMSNVRRHRTVACHGAVGIGIKPYFASEYSTISHVDAFRWYCSTSRCFTDATRERNVPLQLANLEFKLQMRQQLASYMLVPTHSASSLHVLRLATSRRRGGM